MPLAEAAPTTTSTDFRVERLLGERNGVRLELLTAPEKGRAVLIVSPTVAGHTVLMQGGLGDVAAMEYVAACVLATLGGVIPLVTGEAFRCGRGITLHATPDMRR